MVGIMKVQIGGNYTETTVEPIYAEYVSKQDFDRAISLLKLHAFGTHVEDDAVELREMTEEFLEECK